MIYMKPEEILFRAAIAHPTAYCMAVWWAWASNPAQFYLGYWRARVEAVRSLEKWLEDQAGQ